MRLIRFRGASQSGASQSSGSQDGPHVGVLDEDAGTVTTLPGSPALADLLALPAGGEQ